MVELVDCNIVEYIGSDSNNQSIYDVCVFVIINWYISFTLLLSLRIVDYDHI